MKINPPDRVTLLTFSIDQQVFSQFCVRISSMMEYPHFEMETKAISIERVDPIELLNYANRTRESLLDQVPEQVWKHVTTRDVKKVVLILCSSRGGSSLLFEILKQTKQLLCLDGEHVPIFKLNCFGFPDSQIDSDQIHSTDISGGRYSSLSRDLIAGLRTGPVVTEFNFHEFALGSAMRLAAQWSHLKIPADEWVKFFYTAQQSLQRKHKQWDSALFLLTLLEVVNANGYRAYPCYYDALRYPGADGAGKDSDPLGPPCDSCCLEEPPFILTKPRRSPSAVDIKNKPILLKASIDAYRYPFIKQVFPNAQFKIIHLTRNPAASINGLYDGWNYSRGFFSHNLSTTKALSISGYSDRFEWGTRWWKFDLPPGWESLTNRPLEYVCGFQWFSAHKHILESVRHENQEAVLRIKFEDLLGSDHQKQATIARVLDFINIDFDVSIKKVAANMPLVMVTKRPLKRRWLSRKEMLWPVVNQKDIRDMSEYLQYPLDETEGWL